MATQKYYAIRRDLYEYKPDKEMNKYRTVDEVKKLFKTSFWILFAAMGICFASYIFLLIYLPNTLYPLIPATFMFILVLLSEFFEEKLYNSAERKKELEEKNASLNQYVTHVNEILLSHNIRTLRQRELLKSECEQKLAAHSRPFAFFNDNAINTLVSVPIAALLSAAIYKSQASDIIIEEIIGMCIVFVMILGLTKIFKKITFYSEGYFKDKYLLDALNEVMYFDEN